MQSREVLQSREGQSFIEPGRRGTIKGALQGKDARCMPAQSFICSCCVAMLGVVFTKCTASWVESHYEDRSLRASCAGRVAQLAVDSWLLPPDCCCRLRLISRRSATAASSWSRWQGAAVGAAASSGRHGSPCTALHVPCCLLASPTARSKACPLAHWGCPWRHAHEWPTP